MSGNATPAERALAALDDLVAVFAANDEDAYFDSFATTARFVLPDTSPVALSVDEYRTLWREWRADGWRVVTCTSTDRQVTCAGDTAVVTHRVTTALGDGTTLNERETVIIDLSAEPKPLVMHEHLSS
ncbi:nuclear transport factor 2 family protein [Gordonia sp. NPDC003424]